MDRHFVLTIIGSVLKEQVRVRQARDKIAERLAADNGVAFFDDLHRYGALDAQAGIFDGVGGDHGEVTAFGGQVDAAQDGLDTFGRQRPLHDVETAGEVVFDGCKFHGVFLSFYNKYLVVVVVGPVDSLKSTLRPPAARFCDFRKACGYWGRVFNNFHSGFCFPARSTCGNRFLGKACAKAMHKFSSPCIGAMAPRLRTDDTQAGNDGASMRFLSGVSVGLSTKSPAMWKTLWINHTILTDFSGFSTVFTGQGPKFCHRLGINPDCIKIFPESFPKPLARPVLCMRLRIRWRGGCCAGRSAIADPG